MGHNGAHRAEFGVVIPQVGVSWAEALAFARRAEDAGFDSIWVIDHVLGFPPQRGILEAWTMMSALAAATSRAGIGAQVLCQSFRHPSLLAKMATTLDLVSGGRLRFLVGAGWYDAEYRAFGYDFPPPGRRIGELEDTVVICRGMFDAGDQPFTHHGRYHHVQDALNTPPPSRRIPIGVGGQGDRLLDIAARHADEWNLPGVMLGQLDARAAALDERLALTGREVRRSVQIVFAPGDEEPPPAMAMFSPALGLRGSPDQMVDRAGQLARGGVSGFYGVVPGAAAMDGIAAVLPELRRAAEGT